MAVRDAVTMVGIPAASAVGRILERAPSIERRIFAPVDGSNPSLVSKLRTLPALWNVRAMVSLDVPWWTWTATDEVARFLSARPAARVFEWGSGASTCWLSRRSASVVSVEHHPEFASSMRECLATFDNVRLLERSATPIDPVRVPVRSAKSGYTDVDFTDYVDTIDDFGPEEFDVIVVDGRAREACLSRAREHVRADGIIVLDNSDRTRYGPALDLIARGRTMHRHHGFGPASPVRWETTIVTSDRG